jgi:hypothetical protein
MGGFGATWGWSPQGEQQIDRGVPGGFHRHRDRRERRRAHRRIKQIVEAGHADVSRHANAAGGKAAQDAERH